MDWQLILDSLPKLAEGVGMTLFLTVVSVAVGFVLALPLAVARTQHEPLIRLPVQTYVYLFRGTPLIVQLFLVYYGFGQYSAELKQLGLWWFFRDELNCALLVLILNTAAYSTEIFRGGINGVPVGQIEAARAVGMGRWAQYRRIIIPQALRFSWPAYTNEVVFVMQATSLVSLVTVTDLFRVAATIAKRSFAIYELYITAALIYLCISYLIIVLFGLVERRLNRHLRQPQAASIPTGVGAKSGIQALLR